MDLYDACETFWFEILCCTIQTHLSYLEDNVMDINNLLNMMFPLLLCDKILLCLEANYNSGKIRCPATALIASARHWFSHDTLSYVSAFIFTYSSNLSGEHLQGIGTCACTLVVFNKIKTEIL